MADKLLLDTGALVALLDRSERRHRDCVSVLESTQEVLVTTDAVLTEALHLLGPRWDAQKACLDFVLRGGALVMPSAASTLKRVYRLMEKYRGVPMDYADATLVALGEEIDTNVAFTLDRRGFSAYRLNQRKPFWIVP